MPNVTIVTCAQLSKCDRVSTISNAGAMAGLTILYI